jgi:hypothetical protein
MEKVEKGSDAHDGSQSGDAGDQTATQEIIVGWEGPDDPENPMNWASSRKTFTIVMVSAVTFNM